MKKFIYKILVLVKTILLFPKEVTNYFTIGKHLTNNTHTSISPSLLLAFQYHKNFSGKEELHTILNNYFKNIFQLELQHGWLNVLEKNSYNRPHFHSGTNINFSGVYYLSNNNNNINLTKDGETFEIKPKLFEYLIFPHHLIHYVLPEDRNEKRICYAFNLERVI